jgi:hypothetical protein
MPKMSYLAICTFDLENATYQDYQAAYTALEAVGLTKVIIPTNGGHVVMPTTTTAGEFDGASAAAVRDYVRDQVRQAFAAQRLSSEIFVAVGGNWAWGAANT